MFIVLSLCLCVSFIPHYSSIYNREKCARFLSHILFLIFFMLDFMWCYDIRHLIPSHQNTYMDLKNDSMYNNVNLGILISNKRRIGIYPAVQKEEHNFQVSNKKHTRTCVKIIRSHFSPGNIKPSLSTQSYIMHV